MTPSPVGLTRCDSRFIARCAVKLADESYSRTFEPDEWAILHNRTICVLSEMQAQYMVGETTPFWVLLAWGMGIAGLLCFLGRFL